MDDLQSREQRVHDAEARVERDQHTLADMREHLEASRDQMEHENRSQVGGAVGHLSFSELSPRSCFRIKILTYSGYAAVRVDARR